MKDSPFRGRPGSVTRGRDDYGAVMLVRRPVAEAPRDRGEYREGGFLDRARRLREADDVLELRRDERELERVGVPPVVREARGDLGAMPGLRDLLAPSDAEAHAALDHLEALDQVVVDVLAGDRTARRHIEVDERAAGGVALAYDGALAAVEVLAAPAERPVREAHHVVCQAWMAQHDVEERGQANEHPDADHQPQDRADVRDAEAGGDGDPEKDAEHG